MIGFDPNFDYLLDPQRQRPLRFCEGCGGEIYGSGGCIRCQRRLCRQERRKYAQQDYQRRHLYQ